MCVNIHQVYVLQQASKRIDELSKKIKICGVELFVVLCSMQVSNAVPMTDLTMAHVPGPLGHLWTTELTTLVAPMNYRYCFHRHCVQVQQALGESVESSASYLPFLAETSCQPAAVSVFAPGAEPSVR